MVLKEFWKDQDPARLAQEVMESEDEDDEKENTHQKQKNLPSEGNSSDIDENCGENGAPDDVVLTNDDKEQRSPEKNYNSSKETHRTGSVRFHATNESNSPEAVSTKPLATRKSSRLSSLPQQKMDTMKRRSDSAGKQDSQRKRSKKIEVEEEEEVDEEEESSEWTAELAQRKKELIDEVALLTRETMIVVDKTIQSSQMYNDRVKIIKKFNFLVPKMCQEARRGDKKGEWKRKDNYRGIPSRKFTQNQMGEFGTSKNAWPVQSFYESQSNPDKYKVLYEGWVYNSNYQRFKTELEETAPDLVAELKIRNRFQARIQEIMKKENRDFHVETLKSSPDSPFWLYQDLSYFHSMLQKDQGLAPIWYLNGSRGTVRPPRYSYTPINILPKALFDYCLGKDANKTFDELCVSKGDSGRSVQLFGRIDRDDWPCEAKQKCICDYRYSLLYGEAGDWNGHRFTKNLIPRPDGTLDAATLVADDGKVLMECSNRCGCSYKCPRRQVQRGQQKSLVICNESHKGFGVRAAESFKSGEFLCEYTGTMRYDPGEDYKYILHAYQRETRTTTPPGKKSRPKEDSPKEEKVEKAKAELSEVDKQIEDDLKALGEVLASDEDGSYDAKFEIIDDKVVICAMQVGNVARFINHSCNSNAIFVEVYSRRFETDPLIPRIAVFAIRDIELGEEVTVNYYGGVNKEERGSSIRCLCKADNCRIYLPQRRD